MSESGGQENAAFAFNVIYSVLDSIVEKEVAEDLVPISLEVAISQAEMYAGTYQQATVTKSTFERGQMLFGINEPVIEHIGNGQLSFEDEIYEPIDNNTYQMLDGRRKIGFTSDEHGSAQYFSERLYWTSEKINWFQSTNALRIALGASLLMLLIGLVIRPLIQLKKNKRPIQWKSMMTLIVLCLLIGFGILLIGYAFEISLTRGTPMIYKIGLLLTTAGAILAALYPVAIIRNWKKIKRSDFPWLILNVVGISLLVICFWKVNLIGMNYY